MQMTQQAMRFLEGLRLNPGDYTLRLVYGDWLLEQGETEEGERQQWLGKVGLAPRDEEVRRGYVQWLRERGMEVDARVQEWIAEVWKGKYRAQLVLTREGVLEAASTLWGKLSRRVRGYYLEMGERIFAEADTLEIVVVDEQSPSRIGLKRQTPGCNMHWTKENSPILYYQRIEGLRLRVVPKG